jgi:hypothetical protein
MSQVKQISPRVRVEPGPVRRTAVASEELLADEATAKHYQVGRRDAAGEPIELGKEMTYLDYRGARVFKVYLLSEAGDGERYVWQSEHPQFEDAVVAATKLAAQEGDL